MEFKLASNLMSLAMAFRSSGKQLNAEYRTPANGDVSQMMTAEEYMSVCLSIKELIDQYAGLVEKDAADIQSMCRRVKLEDIKLSRILK